jgi:esterase/lipase superfamily enzyme/TPR repeat protein
MVSRVFLISFAALSSLFYSTSTRAQGVQIQFGGAAALPDKQLNNALGFDAPEFEELQKNWTASALPQKDLLTLGKGWAAQAKPETSEFGIQILKQLGNKGSDDANLALGLLARSRQFGGSIGSSRNYLELAADAGNTTAQQALGRSLTDPNSVDFDPKVGVNWLQTSIKAGNVSAKGDLASAFEFGIGVPVDRKEAETLWNDGSKADPSLKLPFAEFKIRNGTGFSDPGVAKLIADAAKSGDVSAGLVQATNILNSATPSAQKVEALKTLSAFANSSGDKADLAMVALGKEALKAPAGTTDFYSAENWFKMAANKGNIEGQAQLGKYYVDQYGDQKGKSAVGLQLLDAAAARGNSTAILALASPKASPQLDSLSRFSRALTGLELSGGEGKSDFQTAILASCDPKTASGGCAPVPVFYFTNRRATALGNGEEIYDNRIDPDTKMKAGVSRAYAPIQAVSVAGPPQLSWWQIFVQEAQSIPGVKAVKEFISSDTHALDPNKQFELHNIRVTSTITEFLKSIHEIGIKSGRPKAFVYVHGFANSFDSAAIRMALISQQYNYPGVPIVFDWASANSALVDTQSFVSGDLKVGYLYDLRMVKRSCSDFQEVLASVVKEFGAGNVMVLAHSMGGELVSDMLTACAGGNVWDNNLKIGRLVFAAPDVDAVEFGREAKAILEHAGPVALYASQNDIALAISAKFEDPGSRRLGQGGKGLFVRSPIQSIDASQVENGPGADPNNHGYVFETRQVRQDLIAMLRDVPLDQRDCIVGFDGKKDPPGSFVGSDPSRYWVVQADCQ